MRLKRKTGTSRVDWAVAINDKNLKYEIETIEWTGMLLVGYRRSMIRISSMRLKRVCSNDVEATDTISRSMIRISSMRLKPLNKAWVSVSVLSINDKNLKYEIETLTAAQATTNGVTTINDKNLKYEIETLIILDYCFSLASSDQ